MRFLILMASLTMAIPALAHHSSAAYDTASSTSVSGVVERLTWRNPHVIISLRVEDESGQSEVWALETAGIQDLVEDGWTRDLVGEGQPLTVEIRPTKRGDSGGIIRWVTLADGRVLPIDPASPTGNQLASMSEGSAAIIQIEDVGSRLAARDQATREDYLERRDLEAEYEARNRPAELPIQADTGQMGALDPANRAAYAGVATFDFTGIWAHRVDRERAVEDGGDWWEFLPIPELTPKAQAIRDETMARRAAGDPTADPAALCYPHGLLRSMTRVGNMMLLQIETALFMNHRMNNDYRAIYWDGRDHVDESVRIDSYNGDAIGYWTDDYLYVETIGFGSPEAYINPGVPLGEQARVEERWRLINDGNTLEIEFRMTDPEHWVGEWVATKLWDRVYGADIAEANCIYALDADLAR